MGAEQAADGPQGFVAALSGAVTGRGLTVRVNGRDGLVVRNPAGDPDPDDPRGQLLAPGLAQEVACRRREDDGGAWWWFWVWSGPTRHSPPEFEPLCRAREIGKAADRIAHVLAVPFTGAAGSADGRAG